MFKRWLKNSPYSQSDIARIVAVSRSAVSKWCLGAMYPSPENARVLENLSSGEVPAGIWPRRFPKEGATPGARAICSAARELDLSIMGLARRVGLPQRSFARWAAGEYQPRPACIRTINSELGLSLTASDFEVRA